MRYIKPSIYFFMASVMLFAFAGVAHAKKCNIKYKNMDKNRDCVIIRSEWRGSDQSFLNQDWNRDGVLSGNEVKPGSQRNRGNHQVRSGDRFTELDHNNDGVITRTEWHHTSRSFQILDRNHNGNLTRDEFFNREQTPVAVFRELDVNNDGWVTRDEWRIASGAFNRLDTNGDNRLSENEFNGREPKKRTSLT